jgi:hypothetical protein
MATTERVLVDFRPHILLCERNQWVGRQVDGKLSTPERCREPLGRRSYCYVLSRWCPKVQLSPGLNWVE